MPDAAGAWLQRAVLRGLGRLPARALVRLSGEPPVVVDGQTLDPQLQLLRAARRHRRTPGFLEPTVEAGRARLREELGMLDVPKVAVAAVRDLVIDGAAGPLRARHYTPPAGAAGSSLLVFLHGGGFTVGDLDTHDQPCRILCREGGVPVLSVDYRLAPEHPFPAALDDAHAALAWARANAVSLGADPARVCVGGDSAGANLAAVVAQEAARVGRPPAAQLLVYPPTDSETPYPSRALFGRGFFLDQRDRDDFSRCYVGGTGATGESPRVSPLRAAELPPLPPALVVTAGFDILRDEGEAYAARLRDAGTRVVAWREPALGHGFINVTGASRAARRATERVGAEWGALVRSLGSAGAGA